jgi:hypothetical protein
MGLCRRSRRSGPLARRDRVAGGDSRPLRAGDARQRRPGKRLPAPLLVPSSVSFAPLPEKHRLLVHFGAVDYFARVSLNGHLAAEHEGGYSPFAADITALLKKGTLELVVFADDDPLDLAKPRGKQDWHEQAPSIWYPRTTGIWQSVWLEVVPPVRLASLRWTPDLERGEVRLVARIEGPQTDQYRLAISLRHADRELCDDLCSVGSDGEVRRSFPVARPGRKILPMICYGLPSIRDSSTRTCG